MSEVTCSRCDGMGRIVEQDGRAVPAYPHVPFWSSMRCALCKGRGVCDAPDRRDSDRDPPDPTFTEVVRR